MTSAISLVVFSHGQQLLAVEAQHVLRLGPWNSSVTTAELISLDGIIPCMQSDTEQGTPRFFLQLQGPQQSRWLKLNQEPLLLELTSDFIWPLPALLQKARQHPAIKALGWHSGQLLTLLDAKLLVA